MLERLIRYLEGERKKLAVQAMEAPAKSEFDRGVEVGIYRGMKKAEEILEELLNEAAEKESRL